MSKIQLPKVQSLVLPQGLAFELPAAALQRWNDSLVAKEDSDDEKDTSISVYDPIGMDPWTGGGVTAKRIAGALRSIGKRDVVVNINSPGGDLFEGIAIYNLLRDHPGRVTTRVVGLAASAASVIAMAGDEIQVARAGFMMIHNVWVMAIGNRNDLRDSADQLETFDDALAGVYAARTGKEKKEIAKLMDRETWFSGDQAIEGGFADALLPADEVEEKSDEQNAAEPGVRAVDMALARLGMPRSQRRALINQMKELGGKPGAAAPKDLVTQNADRGATHDAGGDAEKAKQMTESFLESVR
jgi:ATP-dependent Clp protease, protease subunit